MNKNLVIIKNCSNHFEASFVKNFLKSNGVDAWTDRENSLLWTGRYAVMSRGVPVRVRNSDLKRARRLLKDAEPQEATDEDAEWAEKEEAKQKKAAALPNVDVACPNCGANNVTEVKLSGPVRILMIVLLVGLPLLSNKRTWFCHNCGWEWS